jgi:uncharacterized protein (DUF305 family)
MFRYGILSILPVLLVACAMDGRQATLGDDEPTIGAGDDGTPTANNREVPSDPTNTPTNAPTTTPTNTTPSTPMTPGSPNAPGSEGQAAQYDQRFIDTMVSYAAFTKDVADIGGRRAQNETLKTFARNLSTQHDATVDQLQNWRKLWYPNASRQKVDFDEARNIQGAPPYGYSIVGPTANDSASVLAALRDVPDENFDRVYTDALVAHTRWGHDFLASAKGNVQRAELQRVIDDAARNMQSQLKQLEGWQKSGFENTDPRQM